MEAIEFGTDGWRATLDEFTSDRVRAVGQGVASYLTESGEAGAVAIGYDARETSRGFAEDLARVLCVNGLDVLLPERDCPTPVVAWAIRDRDLAGALVVTASHNPPDYNGVKFIPSSGAPALPAVTEAIEEHLAPPDPRPEAEWGTVSEVDFVTPHADHTIELIDGRLDGMTIAYDAMHGSGRGVTDALLERAGADVRRLRCDRDPTFGGEPPEPSRDHLSALIETVASGEADLGIANDGDADRLAVVTPDGFLNENHFFAAIYDYLLQNAAGPAVRTVSTTYLIDRIAEIHGERVIEVPVGFKWVAKAMADHDALIGGEESGGFTVRGHVREKDGVLMALLAATAAAERPFEDRVRTLLDRFGEVHQDKVSIDCPDDRKAAVVSALGSNLPDRIADVEVASVNDADGFKIQLVDGSWLLVRPSGTEPKLRIYAEAESEDRIAALLSEGRDLASSLV